MRHLAGQPPQGMAMSVQCLPPDEMHCGIVGDDHRKPASLAGTVLWYDGQSGLLQLVVLLLEIVQAGRLDSFSTWPTRGSLTGT